VGLARGILDGSVDRIDGVWRLGGCVHDASYFNAHDYVALVDPFDELESVTRQSERDLWDASAYERERARGAEVLTRYGDGIDEALRRVVARGQTPT